MTLIVTSWVFFYREPSFVSGAWWGVRPGSFPVLETRDEGLYTRWAQVGDKQWIAYINNGHIHGHLE